MADNFIVNRGIDSIIAKQSVTPGAIWIAEDGQYLCLDSKDGQKRIRITDIIDMNNMTDDEKSALTYYSNKIYIDGFKIKRYNANTNELETISELESDVLESDNEFNYDSNDSTKATLADSSSPKKGTIVVDANGDVGVVTSSTSDLLSITIIANNKSKNVLTGYDIYFDSNYSGKQVGTFECPFSDSRVLFNTCKEKLEDNSLTTIHIKSNSTFKYPNFNSPFMTNKFLLNNVIFTTNGSAMLEWIPPITTIEFANVTFSNLKLNISTAFHFVESTDSLIFDNCQINSPNNAGVTLCGSKIAFKNSDINTDIYFGAPVTEPIVLNINRCKINGCISNSERPLQLDIYNSTVNGLEIVNETNEVNIYNTEILDKLNVTCKDINLYNGNYTGTNNVEINATNINIGTFNFNGVTPNLTGNVNKLSGLSSEQVYDKTTGRGYGEPNDTTLKSHLDKIGESINQLDTKLSGTDSLVNAFITKNTFTTIDELMKEFRIGDVMTYVSESGQNLQFNHNLKGINHYINEEYDYESMNYNGEVEFFSDLPLDAKKDDVYSVQYNDDYTDSKMHYIFDGLNWNEVAKINYFYYQFELENASYFAKHGDVINLVSYHDFQEIKDLVPNEDFHIYVTGTVHSVLDNKITVKIKYENLIEQITNTLLELVEDNINGINYEDIATTIVDNYLTKTLEKSIFEQAIKVSHKDRLIKLSNGWDKLSGSTDNATGNYHIIKTYGALSSIENDATRPIGTLAYVEDIDTVYQWKYIDDNKTVLDWIEFSSGTGGAATAILELVSKSDNYGLQITDTVELSVNVYNCTTGILTITYLVDGNATKTRNIDVFGPTMENIVLDDLRTDIGNNSSATIICSVIFTSTDSDIKSPDNSIREIFYLGSTVIIGNMSLDGLTPSGEYNIKKDTLVDTEPVTIPSFNIDNFDINNMAIKIRSTSIANDTYKLKCQLYKDYSLTPMCEFLSDDISGKTTSTTSINFPSSYLDGDVNININYEPGVYELTCQAYSNMPQSSITKYTFILDNSTEKKVLILNSNTQSYNIDDDVENISIDISYVSIFDKSDYTLQLTTTLISSMNKQIYEYEHELITINSKQSKVLNVTINNEDNLLTNIKNEQSYQECKLMCKYHKNKDEYVDSNLKLIQFNIPESILIVRDKLVYNLSSIGKSNAALNKSSWTSSIVQNSVLNVSLNLFDYDSYGWVHTTTADSSETTVLRSDGYETSVLMNLSPLFKQDANALLDNSGVGIYSITNGFTYQIKFKAEKTNDDGTIVECIDTNGRGFIIKEDRVIFSPYKQIPKSMYNDVSVLSSGLTTGTWHEISFVLAVDNSENNPYEQYMYNKDMSFNGKEDYSCTTCAFLFIDGILSGMCHGKEEDWFDNSPYESNKLISLFSQYNYDDKTFYNYGRGEIMHIRQYNKPLSPDEILVNFIADMHDSDVQKNYCIKNGLKKIGTAYVFGNDSHKAIPTLHFHNADLSQLDAIIGDDSKNYIFPNVTVSLSYQNHTIFRHYGCEVKVQGTSSANYAIKNYRLTFYNDLPTEHQLEEYAVSLNKTYDKLSEDDLNKFKLPNDIVYTVVDEHNDGVPDYTLYDDNNTLWHKNSFNRNSYTVNNVKYGKKLKTSINGWLPESRYTLKADYMDSSHTHNTGTAKLANDYMPIIPPQITTGDKISLYHETDETNYINVSLPINDITESTDKETISLGMSVNPVTKIRQAIDGFPILITYSYDINGKTEVIEKGVYMFDIDKNANANFGYDRYKRACKSYEVSNNTTTGTTSAAAGAGFNANLLDNTTYNDYTDNPLMSIKDCIEIRYHYNEDLDDDLIDEVIDVMYDKFKQDIISNEFDKDTNLIHFTFTDLSKYDKDTIIQVLKDKTYIREIGCKEYKSGEIEYIYETLFTIHEFNTESNKLSLLFTGEALNKADGKLRLGLTDNSYPYRDNDIDTHQHDELKHLYMWLYNCKEYNDLSDDDKETSTFKSFAETYQNHFDTSNICHYITLVKSLALVDNLAKNMMITTWNADDEYIYYVETDDNKFRIDYSKSTFCKWYLQFYDLDTSFGLSNDGHKAYDVSIDIKGHNKNEKINIIDGVSKENISDIVKETYNAYDSNLWNLILNAFDNVNYASTTSTNLIQEYYRNIRSRTNNALSLDSFKNKIINSISDKIGEYYFNKDSINKYFGGNFVNSDEPKKYFYMCNGSSKEQMLTWIEKRLIYMDTYYAYNKDESPFRPKTNDSGILYVKPVSPLYFAVQEADDSLIIPQLCTAETTNIINYNITNDANMKMYYLKYITEISNIGQLKDTTLNLINCNNLVKLSLSDCQHVNDLKIQSNYLKELNANKLAISTLNLTTLPNLLSLDISDSAIESLITSTTSSNTNLLLRKININNSALKSLDFSKLTYLESLGKINLTTDESWNSYDKFISQLKKFHLLTNDNNDEYLRKILYQFTKTFSSKGVLDDFINDTLNQNDVNAKIKYIFDTIKYKKELEEQYIPNLAIVDSSKIFSDIKFNTSRLKAIYINMRHGMASIKDKSCNISIHGDNLQYIYINSNHVQLADIKIDISCATLKELHIINSSYKNNLDLTKCKQLEILNLSNNYDLTGVIISQDVRDNGTIKQLDFSQDYEMSFLGTQTDYENNNTIINLENFELTKLLLTNVLSFTEISNMNLTLTKTQDFNMRIPHLSQQLITNVNVGAAKISALYDKNIEAQFTNSLITIKDNMAFDYKFGGRINLAFSNNGIRGLNIDGLNYITSLEYTFQTCLKLNIDDLYYLLGVKKSESSNDDYTLESNGTNAPINCTSFKGTFVNDVGIIFPKYGTSNKCIVPGKLFTNCKSAVDMSNMFGNYGRRFEKGYVEIISDKQNSLILGEGLFHIINNNNSYITSLNINGIFSNCASNFNSGTDIDNAYTLPYDNVDTTNIAQHQIYIYDSYVYALHDNIFEKLTNNNHIGNKDIKSIRTTNVYCSNIFASTSDTVQKCIIKSYDNSSDETVFYNLIKNFSTFVYDGLFVKTGALKYAESINDAAKSSSLSRIIINGDIFKDKNGNPRTLTSLFATFAYFNNAITLKYETVNENESDAMSKEFTREFTLFNNIITSKDKPISLVSCFYNNFKITSFDTMMFLNKQFNGIHSSFSGVEVKTYVSNTSYMFASTNNDTSFGGFLYKSYECKDSNENVYYEIIDSCKDYNIFTNQTELTSCEGMFANRIKFGGLKILTLVNDEQTITATSDLPINIFKDLTNCQNMSYLFYNCQNINLDFSKYDIDMTSPIYLFYECKQLRNISYMFASTNMFNSLPTYNNKGSELNDSKYFYYNITNSVDRWIRTLTDTTSVIKFIDAGYFTYTDYNPYECDENGNPYINNLGQKIIKDDEREYRQYNLIDITTSDIYKTNFKYSHTYIDYTGNALIYQYYKGFEDCSNIISEYYDNDENLIYGFTYTGTDIDNHNKNVHKSYIQIPGFFHINTSSSPLKLIEGVFNGCNKLKGCIPSNIFYRLSNVTNASYVFANCSSIGLNNDTYSQPENFTSEGGNSDITPPYIIPYSILDSLINVKNISYMFSNVKYLSRPYIYSQDYPAYLEKQVYENYNNGYKFTDVYNEIYCLPKYFLHFNSNLTNATGLFYSSSGGVNRLSGMINSNLFVNNKLLTNISYMFANTSITGSKQHSTKTYTNPLYSNSKCFKLYIGQDLLKPLVNLEDVRYLFWRCKSATFTLIDNGDTLDNDKRDLLFLSNIHTNRAMKTSELIETKTTTPSSCYSDLFNNTMMAKLVRNTDTNTFSNDLQCREYFTASDSDTLTLYIKS